MSDSTNIDFWILILQTFFQAALIVFTVFITLHLTNNFKQKRSINGLKSEMLRNLKRIILLANVCEEIKADFEKIGTNEEENSYYSLAPPHFIEFSRKECEINGYFNKLDANLVDHIDQLYYTFESLDQQIIQFNDTVNIHLLKDDDIPFIQLGILENIELSLTEIYKIFEMEDVNKFLESA